MAGMVEARGSLSSGKIEDETGHRDGDLAVVSGPSGGLRGCGVGSWLQVSQYELSGLGVSGLLARPAGACQISPRVLRDLVHIGGLGQEQVSAAR